MVARIESVAALVEQFAKFDGLVGFVGVHRPASEVVRAQPESGEGDERERQPAKNSGEHEGSGASKANNSGRAKRRISGGSSAWWRASLPADGDGEFSLQKQTRQA